MTTHSHSVDDAEVTDDRRRHLLDLFETSRGCALACAVAADGAQARGEEVLARQLGSCAELTEATSLEIARLHVPDAAPLVTLLVACRAACVLAQRVGDARRDDVLVRRALTECDRCELSCARVLYTSAMAA